MPCSEKLKACVEKLIAEGKSEESAWAICRASIGDIEIGFDKIEKRGNQWCVVHCHGEEAGEVIKCFDTREEAEAMHRAIQANKDIGQRKIGFDRASLDDKILLDDDKFLIMPAVIASEIVHPYPEGLAYKPADELEKAAWTAEGRWVKILSHPDSALLQKASDIYGRIENVKFVKDLIEPKTKRPMRRGIRADVKWFKDRVPSDVIAKIKSGDLRDVSIGFTYEEDRTPGEWNKEKYDYVQRNIFIDHLAAPIEAGRCPGPVCGIAVDSLIQDDNECPVCKTIRQVGFLTAGRRLYKQYGVDVLSVIEGNPIIAEPKQVQDEDALIVKAKKVFAEFERLQG